MKYEYAAAVLLCTMLACDAGQETTGPEPGPGSDVPPDVPPDSSTKGPLPMGIRSQGTLLQGTVVQLHGVHLDGAALSGSRLSGKDVDGASLTATDDKGAAVQLTIAQVEADPVDTLGEVLLYTVQYHDPATGSLKNLCVPDADGVQKAVPVSGTWDRTGARSDSATEFTFGCTSGVIAKCVRWGYRPWKSIMGQSLTETHQACTRMARADYCGDGLSHTRDGTLIDAYDPLGLLVETPNDGMRFEAHWNTAGAYCVSRERWLNLDLTQPAKLLGNVLLVECPTRVRLPDSSDLLGDKPCFMKLSDQPRGSIRTSNNSKLLQVAAQ